MSILSHIWQGVQTTLVGLKITVPYIWKKPVTLMYPHERMVQPERARNRLYVNMDDCIGCDQCSRACPVNCIDIETVKAVDGDSPGITSNGKKKALWVTRFDIDIAKCCYCGLCTFPCPTECIKMTDVFEFAEQERNNLIYTYITLTPDEIVEKIELSKKADDDLAAKKAAAKTAEASAPPAAKAAAAPAAAPAAGGDPEKAAKIAEMQAKMAAAKAKAGGESPAPAPAPAPTAGGDDEKAAKIAEMQAKIAAAKAKASGGTAPAATPAPVAAPAAAAPASAPASDEDPEKAARIAAMKARIEEAKKKKG